MTDFRALCAELLEWAERTSSHYFIQADVVVSARAALAEQQVRPTDEELDEFAVFWWGPDTDERTATDVIECGSMAAFARAVLAKWGQP